MGVLEEVNQLRGQGLEESAIVNQLKNKGVSPKDITEALSQVKIKSAVASEEQSAEGNQTPDMQPSIMGDDTSGGDGGESLPTEGSLSDQDLTPPIREGEEILNRHKSQGPRTQELDSDVPRPMGKTHEEGNQQEEYSPQEYFPPQEQHSFSSQSMPQPQQDYYPQEQGMMPAAMGDADTIIEIAEQVFIEKAKAMQKKVDDLVEFKTISEVKIENISDRLKRIEHSIDSLQAEILEKVGSYGRGIESVKREMEMVQDSFGKVVNDLADHGSHKHAHAAHTTHKTTHSKTHAKSKTTRKARKR